MHLTRNAADPITPSMEQGTQAVIETGIETTFQDDTETVSIPETGVSKADNNPDLRERVKRLYFQGIRPEVICGETGVKRGTLRTWINRYGWLRTVNAAKVMLEKRETRVLSIQPAPPSAGSTEARETLAKVIQKAAGKLAEVNPGPNLKELRKVGKALEPLVRSAKIVHGWGSESVGGVVMSEVLGHEQEPQSSIAISADVQQVSCGPDTATGSVQKPAAIESIPQDPQVPTPQ